MKSKSLNVIFTLLLYLYFSPITSLASESDSACFKTKDDLMIHLFGVTYKNDENLITQPIEKKLEMISDMTPALNPTRYLIDTSSGKSCLVLTVPFAQTIKFTGKSNNYPTMINTMTAGQSDEMESQFEANYSLNTKIKRYELKTCKRHFVKKNKKRVENYDCNKFIEGN